MFQYAPLLTQPDEIIPEYENTRLMPTQNSILNESSHQADSKRATSELKKHEPGYDS